MESDVVAGDVVDSDRAIASAFLDKDVAAVAESADGDDGQSGGGLKRAEKSVGMRCCLNAGLPFPRKKHLSSDLLALSDDRKLLQATRTREIRSPPNDPHLHNLHH